jgi:hypothetical protein
MTTSPATIDLDLPLFERRAWMVGLGGLAACALGALLNLDQFVRSYLVAFCFCLGIALGSLAILLLQYLTGGGWGLVLRRPWQCSSSPFSWGQDRFTSGHTRPRSTPIRPCSGNGPI